ncbi:hypothetical protein Ancab_001875 [Ancistrocladus abbreviatus]
MWRKEQEYVAASKQWWLGLSSLSLSLVRYLTLGVTLNISPYLSDAKIPSIIMFQFKVKLYVATCSPARDAGAGYIAWGHSTLVGPFGEVLVTTEHEEAIVMADIDYTAIEQRRSFLPLEKQRCGDLYQLVDVLRLSS